MIEQQVRGGVGKLLLITKNIKLSHVFYADDVFLFGSATTDNMTMIMNTQNKFSTSSGLQINMRKSSLIFPLHMSHVVHNSIALIYRFTHTSTFEKYLGVDIRPNKLKIANFMGLLDKNLDKIRGWQAKLLNVGEYS